MAKDDINVIMYKILRYLYECKKAGIRIMVKVEKEFGSAFKTVLF